LAQLAAEGPRAVDPPPPPPHQAVVVDLAARRRRRVTGLLGAAAAVVVLGIGVSQVVDLGESASDDSDSAGASSSQADQPEGAAEGRPNAPSLAPGDGPDEGTTDDESLPAAVPQVGRKGFKDSVTRLRGSESVASSEGVPLNGDQLTSESMFVCPTNDWGAGQLVAVSYLGGPAVLAYRPPTGDTQSVELLQCGSGAVLRSVVIPSS
ncbi:hypothetical protein, partial [Nocardioides sp.]|uniref:hypothetical protein n=1 Tax=Nocardioides sp. TaxID=35761 RepID=UPI00271A5714